MKIENHISIAYTKRISLLKQLDAVSAQRSTILPPTLSVCLSLSVDFLFFCCCCAFLMGFHLFAINLSLFIFIIVWLLCPSACPAPTALVCAVCFCGCCSCCSCVSRHFPALGNGTHVSVCVCVCVLMFGVVCVRAINCYYRHDAACPRRRLLCPFLNAHILSCFN